MANTPVATFRIPEEMQSDIRRIIAKAKQHPEIVGRLLKVIGEPDSGKFEPNACGPFINEAAVRKFIKSRLVADLHPEMIVLFGSRARGDFKPRSDFDLLVIMEDDEIAKMTDPYLAVRKPLVGSGVATDVIPCSVSDWEKADSFPGTIIHAANTEGVTLYESPKRRRQNAA